MYRNAETEASNDENSPEVKATNKIYNRKGENK
jgi:hypothetical protein